MATILVAAIFLIVAFAFMAGALAFAQYKKKQQSCCGDALETHERSAVENSSCFTCPRRKKVETDINNKSIKFNKNKGLYPLPKKLRGRGTARS